MLAVRREVSVSLWQKYVLIIFSDKKINKYKTDNMHVQILSHLIFEVDILYIVIRYFYEID